jgi:hypothetical protein
MIFSANCDQDGKEGRKEVRKRKRGEERKSIP